VHENGACTGWGLGLLMEFAGDTSVGDFLGENLTLGVGSDSSEVGDLSFGTSMLEEVVGSSG